jgi:hypothetical protein
MAPKILLRLMRQMRSKGAKNAYAAAYAALNRAGLMKGKKLTAKGRRRNAMTPAQRAKARAAKASGRSPRAYKYNKRTNRARLKRR